MPVKKALSVTLSYRELTKRIIQHSYSNNQGKRTLFLLIIYCCFLYFLAIKKKKSWFKLIKLEKAIFDPIKQKIVPFESMWKKILLYMFLK